MPLCPKRTFLFITGASYGLGRACAIGFGCHPSFLLSNSGTNDNNIKSNLDILLLARSKDRLEQTRLLIHKENDARGKALRHNITIFPSDLSQTSILEDSFRTLMNGYKVNLYHHAIFVNNVGSLGPLGNSLSDLQEFQTSINLNIISSCWLSSKFLQRYHSKHTTIVNISSLCAIKPFTTMGTYCMTKASRDMYHKVMAKEWIHNKNIRIWNYAPGPCDTNMTKELASNNNIDSSIKKKINVKKKKQIDLIKPYNSMKRLVKLVLMDENSYRVCKFQSGDHVDYYDL